MFGIAMLAVIAGFLCYAAMRRNSVRVALLVLVAILASIGAATAGSFARTAVFEIIMLGIVWWGVSRLVRFNMLGYFLFFATVTAAQSVCIAALLLLGWPLVARRSAAVREAAHGANHGDAS